METRKAAGGGVNLESARLLQLVLDTIPQKVFWKDTESVYLGCNQLFAADAGLESPEEIIGLTDFELPWTEDEARFYRSCDRRVMDSNEPEIGIVETQTTSTGELTWLETNKVPLLNDAGEVIGMLGSYHDITKIKKAEQMLRRSHEHLEKCIEERTKRLRYIAQHDSLTNLSNRRHFQGELEKVVFANEPFAMLFVDLDRFKPVNDSLGHDAGDQLLIQIGEILLSAAPGGCVGRFGGDEFTILLRNVRTRDEVIETCNLIQKSMHENVVIEGAPMPVSASIGIVIDLEGNYRTGSEVLRDADIAMYDAKRSGKAGYRVCSDDLLQDARERLTLEKMIREGITNNEFHVAYQPILDLATGKPKAFEALVRWQNPELGLLGPDEFLSLAEETGLLCDIGEQVVLDVCTQLANWRLQNLAVDMTIGVNLSVVQLRSPDFLGFLAAAVESTGLRAEDISIEITESLLLEENENSERSLKQLRERGHRLMLDDFGTGYSSLSYVHRFQFDSLKIDKSFIQSVEFDRSSQAIVKTIIGLAENLDLDIVAEGVETESQEAWLQEANCQLAQGFRYATPMSAAEATEYLKQQSSSPLPVVRSK